MLALPCRGALAVVHPGHPGGGSEPAPGRAGESIGEKSPKMTVCEDFGPALGGGEGHLPGSARGTPEENRPFWARWRQDAPGSLQETIFKGKSSILGQVAPGGPREPPGYHFYKENRPFWARGREKASGMLPKAVFGRKIDLSGPGGARSPQGDSRRLI